MAGPYTPGEYIYLKDGQKFHGTPTRFQLGDPMIYYDEQGNVMLRPADYGMYGKESFYIPGTLKNVLTLTIEEAKEWARIEHNADDNILALLINAATANVDNYLNRLWTDSEDQALPDIKLQMLKIILHWYENRGDTGTIPADIKGELRKHRKEPGF